MQIARLALLGAASGVVAKLADNSDISWASDLGTYPAIWLFTSAVIGRFSPDVIQAALRGVAFFIGLSLGYYAWSVFVLQFGIGGYLFLWGGLAVTAVPVVAAVLWWASRHRGPLAGFVMAMTAGLALSDGTVIQMWWRLLGELPGEFPLRPVQALADVVVALVVVGIVPVHRATRGWALALLLPAAVLATAALNAFYGTLLR